MDSILGKHSVGENTMRCKPGSSFSLGVLESLTEERHLSWGLEDKQESLGAVLAWPEK